MKILRWQGLAALAVVLALLAAFWWLLADWLLKAAIEKGGERLAAARVELVSADLGLMPLGISLQGLSVADADAPMRNVFEFDRADFHVDPYKLLLGHVVITDMQVMGLRFATARSHSGALAPRKPATRRPATQRSDRDGAESADGEGRLAAMAALLPDAETILEREPLLVTDRITALEKSYDEQRPQVEEKLAALPDDSRLAELQAAVERLTDGKVSSPEDFRRRQQELKELKTQIATLQRQVRAAQEQLIASRRTLAEPLQQLRRAPAEDLQRLRDKYRFDSEHASHVSRLLFGDRAASWMTRGRNWYARLRPFVGGGEQRPRPPRGTGRYVHFPVAEPLPDVLIRRAELDIRLRDDALHALLRDLTPQPDILGRPATLAVRAQRLSDMQDVTVNATFDHVDPQRPVDRVDFRLDGMTLRDKTLSRADALPLTLRSASARFDGQLVVRGEDIEGSVDSRFSAARFDSSADGGLAAELAAALRQIDRFAITTAIAGQWRSPRITLDSDLDERLRDRLAARFAQRQRQLEAELKQRLEAKAAAPLRDYQARQAEFAQQLESLQAQQTALEQMLDARLAEFRDEGKKQLDEELDRARERLRDKLQLNF